MDKFYELRMERDDIDLQDFVLGLAILSRIEFINKIKCIHQLMAVIFYLTDLD